MSNKDRIYLNDTKIISRTRGWRTHMHNAIKSFPPAGLEEPGRVAVITIRITLKNIIITKKWE